MKYKETSEQASKEVTGTRDVIPNLEKLIKLWNSGKKRNIKDAIENMNRADGSNVDKTLKKILMRVK